LSRGVVLNKMITRKHIIFCCALTSLICGLPSLGHPLENLKEEWKHTRTQELDTWDPDDNKPSWKMFSTNEKRSWADLKADVLMKWNDFAASTRRTWVDYDRELDTRSRIDFKEGKIILETVIPADTTRPERKARDNIFRQLRKIMSKNDIISDKILENQITDKKGQIINGKNLNNFIDSEVAPSIKVGDQDFTAQDQTRRRKYSTTIGMVPNHLAIRAEKYIPAVRENARKYNISPQLIMAVIHTESYFNPLAVSKCGAHGLMQIMPSQAGREVSLFLNGVNKAMSTQDLFTPEFNIEIGTAYLHLLKYRHFDDVKLEFKNDYVTICGYNWGPTTVRKKLLNAYPTEEMSSEELYLLLRRKAPQETSNYLKNVVQRIPLYHPLFL
jgi:membrane-bound lytic murein transglycosylase C